MFRGFSEVSFGYGRVASLRDGSIEFWNSMGIMTYYEWKIVAVSSVRKITLNCGYGTILK